MTGAVESVAGATVVQVDLPRARQARELEHGLDLVLGRAVEHRCRERDTLLEMLAQVDHLRVAQRVDVLGLPARVVDQRERLAQIGDPRLRLQHLADLLAETLRRPAEVGFEDLSDVHPRRHAERVQHHVHRHAVRRVRHVLDRNDLGDDALVAVAACHLVARLQAPLHRQVDLDHLLHAGRQLVALGQLLLLRLEREIELDALLREALHQLLELARGLLARQPDIEPAVTLDLGRDRPS